MCVENRHSNKQHFFYGRDKTPGAARGGRARRAAAPPLFSMIDAMFARLTLSRHE